MDLSLNILKDDNSWTKEKQIGSDIISSKRIQNIGKIFKYEVRFKSNHNMQLFIYIYECNYVCFFIG